MDLENHYSYYPSGYPEVLHLEFEEDEYTLIQHYTYYDGWIISNSTMSTVLGWLLSYRRARI